MKLWLKLSISLVLLFFIFYKINFKNVLNVVAGVNFLYLAFAILVYIIFLIVNAYAFYILVKYHKNIEVREVIHYHIYCWSIGLLLPGRTGDFMIIPFLKKKGVSIGEGLAAVITNKLTSIILTILIAFFGLYLFFDFKTSLILLTILISVFLVLFLVSSERSRLFIRKNILRSYEHHFRGFSRNLKSYFTEKIHLLIRNIFWTMMKILTGGLSVLIIFKSLDANINFFILIIIFNTVTLLSFVPFTLSGLGLRESAIWFLLAKIGISSEIIGSAILLSLAMTYILGFVFSITLKVDYQV